MLGRGDDAKGISREATNYLCRDGRVGVPGAGCGARLRAGRAAAPRNPHHPAFTGLDPLGQPVRRGPNYVLRRWPMAWPDFKIADDPRVTRVGRMLRKYSLDELPQLYNVLRGEMTLVGPRPCSVKLADYDLWQVERLDVTPGIVGRWQAEGRGRMDFAERCRLDIRQVAVELDPPEHPARGGDHPVGLHLEGARTEHGPLSPRPTVWRGGGGWSWRWPRWRSSARQRRPPAAPPSTGPRSSSSSARTRRSRTATCPARSTRSSRTARWCRPSSGSSGTRRCCSRAAAEADVRLDPPTRSARPCSRAAP